MKTICILTFLMASAGAYAKMMAVSAGLEKTVAGNQYTVTLTRETAKKWSFGLFYQEDLSLGANHEKITSAPFNFYGSLISVPLVKSQKIQFSLLTRVGLADNQFLVIVPSMETRMTLNRRYAVAAGAGYRMGYPALSGRLIIKLF